MALQRVRNWVFTINNFSEEDEEIVENLINNEARRGIAEHEWGQEGTAHIQGFIQFTNPRTFGQVKTKLPRAHIEPAKGNWKENFAYCSKDDQVFAYKCEEVLEGLTKQSNK